VTNQLKLGDLKTLEEYWSEKRVEIHAIVKGGSCGQE